MAGVCNSGQPAVRWRTVCKSQNVKCKSQNVKGPRELLHFDFYILHFDFTLSAHCPASTNKTAHLSASIQHRVLLPVDG